MNDLISRQAAIDALMVAVDDVGVLDAEDIETVFALLPSEQPERKTGRWILVSERFPEEGEEVLVYLFDGKSPYLAWIQDGLWRTEEFVIDVDEEPVAWMPLPEPYRKDGEQDG